MNSMHTEGAHGLIDHYLEAISTNMAEKAPLAEDAVYGGPMVPDNLRGAQAIRQYLSEIAPFIAGIRKVRGVYDQNGAAVIVEITGIRKRRFTGSMFFEFENGLISSVQVFFDTRLLMQNVG